MRKMYKQEKCMRSSPASSKVHPRALKVSVMILSISLSDIHYHYSFINMAFIEYKTFNTLVPLNFQN